MKDSEVTTSWVNLTDRLRSLLRTLKVKQKDFAGACGVSENYVSMLVTGRCKSISEPLCRLICQVYGVSETWLKEGVGEPFDTSEAKSAEQLRGRIAELMENRNSAQLQQMLGEAMKQIKE